MNWTSYFEKNRAQRRVIPWERGVDVDKPVRDPLVHSLQRFQIGESGEGRHMKRGAARTGDADYAQAVELFIAEEQAHAAWMAKALQLMGADLLKRHWTDLIFVGVRRMMGLTFEVLVLLAAEVVGGRFFRVVHRGVADPVIRTMLAQMISDEDGHVAFQAYHLRKVAASLPAPLLAAMRCAWWGAYHAAFFVVAYDHRMLFRALCVSPREFMEDCDAGYREVCAMVFRRRAQAAPAMQQPVNIV